MKYFTTNLNSVVTPLFLTTIFIFFAIIPTSVHARIKIEQEKEHLWDCYSQIEDSVIRGAKTRHQTSKLVTVNKGDITKSIATKLYTPLNSIKLLVKDLLFNKRTPPKQEIYLARYALEQSLLEIQMLNRPYDDEHITDNPLKRVLNCCLLALNSINIHFSPHINDQVMNSFTENLAFILVRLHADWVHNTVSTLNEAFTLNIPGYHVTDDVEPVDLENGGNAYIVSQNSHSECSLHYNSLGTASFNSFLRCRFPEEKTNFEKCHYEWDYLLRTVRGTQRLVVSPSILEQLNNDYDRIDQVFEILESAAKILNPALYGIGTVMSQLAQQDIPTHNTPALPAIAVMAERSCKPFCVECICDSDKHLQPHRQHLDTLIRFLVMIHMDGLGNKLSGDNSYLKKCRIDFYKELHQLNQHFMALLRKQAKEQKNSHIKLIEKLLSFGDLPSTYYTLKLELKKQQWRAMKPGSKDSNPFRPTVSHYLNLALLLNIINSILDGMQNDRGFVKEFIRKYGMTKFHSVKQQLIWIKGGLPYIILQIAQPDKLETEVTYLTTKLIQIAVKFSNINPNEANHLTKSTVLTQEMPISLDKTKSLVSDIAEKTAHLNQDTRQEETEAFLDIVKSKDQDITERSKLLAALLCLKDVQPDTLNNPMSCDEFTNLDESGAVAWVLNKASSGIENIKWCCSTTQCSCCKHLPSDIAHWSKKDIENLINHSSGLSPVNYLDPGRMRRNGVTKLGVEPIPAKHRDVFSEQDDYKTLHELLIMAMRLSMEATEISALDRKTLSIAISHIKKTEEKNRKKNRGRERSHRQLELLTPIDILLKIIDDHDVAAQWNQLSIIFHKLKQFSPVKYLDASQHFYDIPKSSLQRGQQAFDEATQECINLLKSNDFNMAKNTISGFSQRAIKSHLIA